MKIAVIGYSGSGKSTISKILADKYSLPLLYLDCVHFLPHWNKRDKEEEKEIVNKFIKENNNWVIDGDYFDIYFDERLNQADKILLLSFNRLSCLYRAYKRSVEYKNKQRESMSPQCEEVIDFAFVKHIIIDRKNDTKVYEEVINKYKSKVIIVKNQKELDELKTNIDKVII